MSVSLYYCTSRATPLTDAETAAVEVVAGSTKMPFDPGKVLPVLDHVLRSVSESRRALPGAEWRVHMDDQACPARFAHISSEGLSRVFTL